MKYTAVFSLILCVFYISACVRAPQPADYYRQKPKTKVSATQVVINFLEAIKNADFAEAYEHIYILNSDKEGYISGMKNMREKDLGTEILKYNILGTQLFKNTAIIFAELQMKKTDNGITETTVTIRYDLSLFDNKWKIIKDSCIENCNQLNSR